MLPVRLWSLLPRKWLFFNLKSLNITKNQIQEVPIAAKMDIIVERQEDATKEEVVNVLAVW